MNILNKNILVIDVETTGFPLRKIEHDYSKKGYFSYKDNSKYNGSRIVQIGWSFIKNYNNTEKYLDTISCYIVQPNGFNQIDNSHFHGVTFNNAKENGLPLKEIIEEKGLGTAIKECDHIIAHNCLFDLIILMNECHRNNMNIELEYLNRILDNDRYICTGEYGKSICNIKINPRFKMLKMPNLAELYYHYYRKNPVKQHDAINDVKSLLEILYKINNNEIAFEEQIEIMENQNKESNKEIAFIDEKYSNIIQKMNIKIKNSDKKNYKCCNCNMIETRTIKEHNDKDELCDICYKLFN